MSQQQQTVLRVVTNNTSSLSGMTTYTFLDLYSSVPILINRSYAELQDISSKNSDYSINLQIPGSKKNNAFFENFYDVDVESYNYNPNVRTACDVLINDETYFKGYIRLNKINVMNSKVEYDVTLYSTVATLFGDMGNNLLKQLNYNDEEYTFNFTFNQPAVVNGWGYSNFGIDGEQPQPVVFPIVHNGYLYSGASVNTSGLTLDERTHYYTSTVPIGSFQNQSDYTSDPHYKPYRINSPNQGLLNNQLKPALSMWNLIKLMFKTYGYTIKSDFFNTPWFKTLYMYGYFSSSGTKFGYNLQTIQQLPLEGIEVIMNPYSQDIYGNKISGLTSLDIIVATKGTGVPCYAADNFSVTINVEVRYHGFLGFQHTAYYNQVVNVSAGTSGTTVNLSQTDCFDGYCAIVYRHYNGVVAINPNSIPVVPLSNLKYYPAAVNEPVLFKDGDFVDFSLVVDINIKQIDILDSLAKKFNLVFLPDPENPRQIIIEPFNYYIAQGDGDIWDYTDKLSYDSGFTVEPALQFIDSNLIFTDSEDGDYGNKVFKDLNNRIYGQKWLYGPSAYRSTTGTTQTVFGPQIIRQWDSQNPADGQIPNGKILLPLGINYAAQTQTSTFGTGGVEQINMNYTGIKTKPKLMWYLGSGNVFLDTLGEVYNNQYTYKTYQISILTSSGTTLPNSGTENIPIISHTMPMGLADKYKINNDSACLLFNSEQPTYVDVQSYNCYTDNSAYNLFYGNRITNVYNPNTRHLTGKFYLKLSDYKNLKANDLIKIQNQYFIWNKINNYNLTNTELTEIELVQANNVPQKYPTRYFKYYYCDTPDTVYTIKTDFTNPNMLNTNFGWSIMYDHNMGTINTGNTVNYSGFTSMFIDDSYTGTTLHYVPYFTQEITQDEYENGDNYPWTCDTLHNHIWSTPNAPYGNLMPTYWINSNYSQTGLNLFINCDDCYNYISTYNIAVGSSTSFGQRICGKIIQTEATENIQNQQNKNITTQN